MCKKTDMKKIYFILILISSSLFAQNKVEKLQYAKTLITVPTNCKTESEYSITDCNGFSAQWIFLKDEMVEQGVHKQIFQQIESQYNYIKKKEIKFISQNQPFQGTFYQMKDKTYRIIGFGRVDEIQLILNLGFEKEPKSNSDLSDFELNFITFN